MKKVLKTVNSFKTETKEDYKLVVDVKVETIDEDNVKATLIVFREIAFTYGNILIHVQTSKTFSENFTKKEVERFKNSVTVPNDTDMYEAVKIIELETAKLLIESKKLFEINGRDLVKSDFEISTVDQLI